MSKPAIYTGPGWEVRQGKWQDSPPDEVEVVISDPPFTDDISSHGARVSGNYKFGNGHVPMREPRLSFGGVVPTEIASPLLEIVSRWVVLFCAQEQLGDYERAVGGKYRHGGAYVRGCIWSATNQQPQFTGDRPASPGEGIAILHRRGHPGGMRWNGGGKVGIYRHPKETGAMAGRFRHGGDIRVHETQKPLGLMLQLVADFSEPGELVWDPYCGSGTTGVACLRLGRRFLGHEMQPHYAEIAAERLRAEDRGLTLQDARRGQQSVLDLLRKP